VRTVFNLAEINDVDPFLILAVLKCESGFNSKALGLNKKNGKVWSKDVGLMQINNVFHEDKAEAMGLDIYNPLDNLLYGISLIKKNGVADYKASLKCIGAFSPTKHLSFDFDTS
jgi:soluble lytic murein transglycosylase-like protein